MKRLEEKFGWKIELTAQAEADLVEIDDFIAKNNPSATERHVS
jgi:plasmid stabilization system protein ParE